MKDALILLLVLLILAMAALDERPSAVAMIDDVTADVHRASAPSWPEQDRVYATCPVTPWAVPKIVKEHQV